MVMDGYVIAAGSLESVYIYIYIYIYISVDTLGLSPRRKSNYEKTRALNVRKSGTPSNGTRETRNPLT